MKNRLKYCVILTVISLIIIAGKLSGQQILSTSGATGQSGTGSISYTLGELVIATHTDGIRSITQGFHQTQIIITAINDPEDTSIRIVAYPNPVYDHVTLKFETGEFYKAEYTLYDLNGKLILKEKFNSNEISIYFDNYGPGVYFLKVDSEGKELRTFKIIKK